MNIEIIKNGMVKVTDVTRSDIKFSNFAGKETDYNDYGNRNFNLKLTHDQAELLREVGVGVAEGRQKEDGTFWDPMVKVNVKYNHYDDGRVTGPSITRYFSEGGCVPIDESLVHELDSDDYESMAMVLAPYLSKKSRTGLKTLYLRELNYMMEIDPLAGIYD